jgi:hypothetical protein
MKRVTPLLPIAALLSASLTASAHHSHALFDMSRANSVSGTVAKLEWNNPHIFIWVYVADRQQKSGYTLYAFESGSVALMARGGWDHNALKSGDRLSVEYMPLRDGRPGGALLRATLADGKVLMGDPLVVKARQALLRGDK